jgi:hypothetical protein
MGASQESTHHKICHQVGLAGGCPGSWPGLSTGQSCFMIMPARIGITVAAWAGVREPLFPCEDRWAERGRIGAGQEIQLQASLNSPSQQVLWMSIWTEE